MGELLLVEDPAPIYGKEVHGVRSKKRDICVGGI